MKLRKTAVALLVIGILSCNSDKKQLTSSDANSYSDIKVVGAMKNVMWKGELGGSIVLDTIADKEGLYGLGPMSYLEGEILINNGHSYISKVTSDSTMSVEKSFDVSAPFFVYANVREWNKLNVPSGIKSIKELESFIDTESKVFKRPFAFKVIGLVSSAKIHIQNLPSGTNVSSPEEAHQGQTDYFLKNEEVEIIGFFSTEHKGVFTHHDSFLHMHLLSADESKMGHLDELEIDKMAVYLPEK